ncbi:esterase family protein [Companilactobacillus sp. RD055328]|uniref:alpha/beta hydrolase n=1 Tax=Companilactobacillus sp. RD055328 TaxID=2916634 RepID=UPI001FC85548|nr:alpha/beta fold hydrolase [Companilactobacillus sp. RD055328]GKQ43450.1 esterase family protein [Companilactobacillus sp. RD055328]
MAIITINHYSEILKINHKANVIIPDDIVDRSKAPIVWLLHGYGGDESSWLRNTTIEALANEHSYIIIMPEGMHSFYTDSPIYNYYTFFMSEFIPYIQNLFNLSSSSKRNFLCGASMGGYGVLNFYLNNEEKFKAVAALSPVMNLVDFINNPQSPMSESEFFAIFNNLKIAEERSISLSKVHSNIKITVGKNDFLYSSISNSTNIYEITSGDHTWSSWSKDICLVFNWFNNFE